jgi:hypothetical protein
MIDTETDNDFYSIPIRERFSNPMSGMLRSVFEQDWGRSDPTYLRWLAADVTDLPDRRRSWLRALAARMEVAGFVSLSDVPAERFDEVVQLY